MDISIKGHKYSISPLTYTSWSYTSLGSILQAKLSTNMAKLIFLLAMVAFASTLLVSIAGAADNSTSPSSPSADPTAYVMLQRFGFPVGILPQGVQGYKLGDDGSSFEVYLAGDCEFRAAKKYVLHYSSRVAGQIAAGSITSLEGVKVKEAFAWFRISEVDVDGDQIKLHVGLYTATVAADQLAVSPQCN